jgi:5-methylcytosine-specific restriction endonuclease McrA
MTARSGAWNGSNWIRRDKRLAIYLRDTWRCAYCKRDLSQVKPKLRTLDHLTPVSDGGTNDETNLVTCCKRCNDSKGARDWVTYCKSDAQRDRILAQVALPLNRALAKQLLAGIFDASTLVIIQGVDND